jgi:hypothetical protein
LNTDIESALETLVNQSGRTDQSVAPVKKKAVGTKPKAARTAKTKTAPQRPLRSSRAGSKTEKLVCRYCGSDDLAPSFKKRSDARLPRLLQEALWLDLAGQGDRACWEDESNQVVVVEARIGSGSELIEWLGP